MSISCLYFVVCGLQYWVTAYLETALNIDDKEVNVYYAFVCLSAPVTGVLMSGIIYARIGGYTSERAYPYTIYFGLGAMVSCLPIPFVTLKWPTYILLWCVFFFGAVILAPLVAFMLNTVEAEKRTTANSIATMAYNLFGYLPSPFIYGMMSDLFSKDGQNIRGQRVAIGVTLYWSIFAIACMAASFYLRYKKLAQESGMTIR